MTDTFQKHLIYVRSYCQGGGLFKALAALEHALNYHNGTRKDGVTPEFHHQLEIAQILIPLLGTLPTVQKDRTLAAVMLHDTSEDYGSGALLDIVNEGLRNDMLLIGEASRLSKNGMETEEYYAALLGSPRTAAVKGADRVHNVESMAGVFRPEKIQKYIDETREFVLPMLKEARRRFPEWSTVYTSLSFRLKAHLRTIERLRYGWEGFPSEYQLVDGVYYFPEGTQTRLINLAHPKFGGDAKIVIGDPPMVDFQLIELNDWCGEHIGDCTLKMDSEGIDRIEGVRNGHEWSVYVTPEKDEASGWWLSGPNAPGGVWNESDAVRDPRKAAESLLNWFNERGL